MITQEDSDFLQSVNFKNEGYLVFKIFEGRLFEYGSGNSLSISSLKSFPGNSFGASGVSVSESPSVFSFVLAVSSIATLLAAP